MKKVLIIISFLCISTAVFSQDYMNVISEKFCECLKNTPNDISAERFKMEIGVCMINVATPYKEQLKKDHDIDISDPSNSDAWRKLGTLIGAKAVGICPNEMLKLSSKYNEKDEEEETEEKKVLATKGKITKVEKEPFITFSVKDEAGKTIKFHWLTFVESSQDLVSSYSKLVGKSVSISYVVQEFFDPKLDEYRQFYIITKLETN